MDRSAGFMESITFSTTSDCTFSTDRRHRGTFKVDIKIEDYNIKRVTFPTYLGVTLDSELRFTKHIEQTTIKALGKLNMLRKLCGPTWGSRPRILKNAYSSIIRTVLEFAAPIWAPASVSSKQKLDSIQHCASKIIIGAVSSTSNEKAEREWGLPSLECRRNLATVKFTNKLRCYKEDHISTRVFNEWPYTKKLKRSSTLQLDEDIIIQINLDRSILNFMQESPFPRRPPKETKITLNLIRPCSKKEDARILKQKNLETIEKISQENFAVAYTDGSSDISLNKGGAGILFQLPNKERKMHKINTGLIASNFTSELLAIKKALMLYLTHLELSDTTEGLSIFSDSRAALEAIIKGDTNITSAINVLLGMPIWRQWRMTCFLMLFKNTARLLNLR
ncbi:reverse transcriptase domain-containing protein [Trichonephila clavipes]|nr:reverse transcriptase domain-containing protein [Trichonephila clavipes]